jgi:hypothetical protein
LGYALDGPIQVALILCVLTAAFAVFCYASSALSVLYGITGFKIGKPGRLRLGRRISSFPSPSPLVLRLMSQPGYGRRWADDHG